MKKLLFRLKVVLARSLPVVGAVIVLLIMIVVICLAVAILAIPIANMVVDAIF